MEEIARALDAAHEAGLIHRDVKPGNILIDRSGAPVILDFGLAREEATGGPGLTGSGELLGTPAYLAPELLSPAAGASDRRADVYALGVTLFEALTHRLPFEAPTLQQLYQQILTRSHPDPRRFRPMIPPDLKVVVETALEKEPERRYARALELADDLRAVREGRPVAARPVSPLGRLGRWVRRRPAQAALAAVLLVALPTVAGLSGYLLAHRDDLRRANDSARAERIERRLEEGFVLVLQDQRRATAIFREVLEETPDAAEALAGLVLAQKNIYRQSACLEELDRHPGLASRRSGLAQLRVFALEIAGEAEQARAAAQELREPESALDFFVAGLVAIHRGAPHSREAGQKAVACFRQAHLRSPRARGLFLFELARAAAQAGDVQAAEETARAITALWPQLPAAWWTAAIAWQIVDPRRALAACREALRLEPRFLSAHNSLGILLFEARDLDAAEAAFRRAIRIAPDYAAPQSNLAGLLVSRAHPDRTDVAEALALSREALRLDPGTAEARLHLGQALLLQGDFPGARDVFRELVRVRPDTFEARNSLGVILKEQGDLDGAIAEYAEALRIRPESPEAQMNLGTALILQGNRRLAIEVFREAIRLSPARATAHFVLGNAFFDDGTLDRAFIEYRIALALEPAFGGAFCGLGAVLEQQGRYRESLESYCECLRRIPPDLAASRYPASWYAERERLAALEDRLHEVRSRRSRPANGKEALELAALCRRRGLRLAEAALLGELLDQDGSLAGDPRRSVLSQAASAAAAAGLGRSHDATGLDPGERAHWRDRARSWIAGELVVWQERLDGGALRSQHVHAGLRRWWADPDLSRLREPGAHEALGEDERVAWRGLWERVRRMLDRLE